MLKTLPCNIILSGYPSALYDERLANWGKNYRALPRAEHLAVLAAMMAVEAEDAAGSG